MHGVRIFIAALAAATCFVTQTRCQNITEYHGDAIRSGYYQAAGLTYTAASNLHPTPGYTPAALAGDVYAQPLYWTPATGNPQIIAATMQNNIYALDSVDGHIVWQRNLGAPFTGVTGPCVPDVHFSNPQGVYGTPAIDKNGILYLDTALQTVPGMQHEIYALNLNNRGATVAGWPVDPGASVSGFTDALQAQHAALLVQGGIVYVPYSALKSDCKQYHGWVVGITKTLPNHPPSMVSSFATGTSPAHGGGIWGPGGVVSDGQNLYVVSGNTKGVVNGVWSRGEAIFRLGFNLTFSGMTNDYFSPADWQTLDANDLDLGSSNAVVVPIVGGATHFMAVGKGGIAYFVRQNMGGIGGPNTQQVVTQPPGEAHTAPAVYVGSAGTYVVIAVDDGAAAGCPPGSHVNSRLEALLITPGPHVQVAWCAFVSQGRGAPIITTTTTNTDPMVWVVGAEGTNLLYGLRLDTGQILTSRPVGNLVTRTQAPIVANGHMFVGANGGVVSFTW